MAFYDTSGKKCRKNSFGASELVRIKNKVKLLGEVSSGGDGPQKGYLMGSPGPRRPPDVAGYPVKGLERLGLT